MEMFSSWHKIASFVRHRLPSGQDLELTLGHPALHPRSVRGFVRDFGMPAGDCGDWRLALADGTGIHARERADGVILVHWDRVDPTCGLSCRLRHAIADAPIQTVMVAAGAGAVIGGLAKGWAGLATGAGIGVLAGLALLLLLSENRDRRR